MWDNARRSPILPDDVEVGGLTEARREVDDGLYRSRWERASPVQRDVLRALAALVSAGPASVAGVAGHGPLAVVGDFNDWDPSATLFTQRGESRQATVTVQDGRCYQYRCFAAADWQWVSDRHEHGYEPNGLAVDNSVLDLTGARGAQ